MQIKQKICEDLFFICFYMFVYCGGAMLCHLWYLEEPEEVCHLDGGDGGGGAHHPRHHLGARILECFMKMCLFLPNSWAG